MIDNAIARWNYYKAVAQYNVGRCVTRLWERACPDIVVQRAIHGALFSLSLRHHALWIFYGDTAANAECPPFPSCGLVWDLGCNIGIYSVMAASNGCRVIAFDIAPVNVLCLNQTARMNGLPIEARLCPVTVSRLTWKHASGHTEAQMEPGEFNSMTYIEAAELFGLPGFVKMDIQGGEIEFLRSNEFRAWVNDLGISIYLEVHEGAASYVWPEFQQVGRIHYLLKANHGR